MEDKIEEREMTKEDLKTPDGVVHLGNVVSSCLLKFGAAAFLLAKDGSVQVANPMYVFYDHKAFGIGDGEVEFIRPIMTDGRPQMIGLKDGEPWEVRVKERSNDEIDES